MEIVNEVKSKNSEEKQKFEHRSLADIQRRKLEKLMKNPEKPVLIPEKRKSDKEYVAPSFVRNVMGSSAGAGSGEFHVYRHLRRKEYARQKHMKQLSETERLDLEFQQKLEENLRKTEEKTNKNRAKRMKKKNAKKFKNKKAKLGDDNQKEDNNSSSDDEKDDEATEEEDDNEKEDNEDVDNTKPPAPETEEKQSDDQEK